MDDYRTRRKEQARHTEQAILQAAMDLSRKQSFDKVSIREICQRAGITTGAFYHHFRSKDDLLARGFAPLLENLGWELVARYYQRRLDNPDDTSSMDSHRFTLRAMGDCLAQAEAEGGLLEGWSSQWTADFLFRHFRGVVIDWALHRGAYRLMDRLGQDYTLFSQVFGAG
mgnify:CR=1 FL=1